MDVNSMSDKVDNLVLKCEAIEVLQSEQNKVFRRLETQDRFIVKIARKLKEMLNVKVINDVVPINSPHKDTQESSFDEGIEAFQFYKEDEHTLHLKDINESYFLVVPPPSPDKEDGRGSNKEKKKGNERVATGFDRLDKRYIETPTKEGTALSKKKSLEDFNGSFRQYPCWIEDCERKLTTAGLRCHVEDTHPSSYYTTTANVTRTYNVKSEYGDKFFMECFGKIFRIGCWIYLNGDSWFWCELLGPLHLGNAYKCKIELVPQTEGQESLIVESWFNRHIEIERIQSAPFICDFMFKYNFTIIEVK